jgi:hypothetical protein
VDDIHHLLGDVALAAGPMSLGAPKDHVVLLGLRELGVFLLGFVRCSAGLLGRLLGLARLAEGDADVAHHGRAVLEEVLCLSPMEWAGDLEHLLKVLGVRTPPTGLRSGGGFGHNHHLLPMALLVSGPLVTAALG